MIKFLWFFFLICFSTPDLIYDPHESNESPEEYDTPTWMLPPTAHRETTTQNRFSSVPESDYENDVVNIRNQINYESEPINTFTPQIPAAVTVDRFINPESIQVELTECTPDKVIVEKLLKSYNSHKTPSEVGVKVWIEVWLQEVNAVNERTADFEAELYLTEIWVDHALNFEAMRPCRENLSLSYEVLDKLWKPQTVFINSKAAHIHKSPFLNIFLMIYANGTVWVNERIQVIGVCPAMEFSSFPMDTQVCMLTLESFNYNNLEVDMRWAEIEKPLLLLKDPIELPDFILTNYSTSLNKVQYPAGVWNELSFSLTFSRRFGYYAIQGFFPTYLTIFISWISFALGIKMIPARTMLGVNSLLALTFQYGNINRHLPPVSYIKALDIWMIVCLVSVFASLIELAIVGVIANRNEKPVRIRATDSIFSSDSSDEEKESMDEDELKQPLNAVAETSPNPEPQWISDAPKHVQRHISIPARPQSWSKNRRRYTLPVLYKQGFGGLRKWCQKKRRRILCLSTDQIDQFSMIMFPTLFALFNIVFWSYYMTRKT
ncbi:hypothetical protein M3Y96_00224300 [Aphelenchoides besseyi]|nr:hypothetical protein M3Y96_00224300 [Aphelenchoides besseyi]